MTNIKRIFNEKGISRKLLAVLAVVVVFATTYLLMLPANAWEDALVCEKPEHVHSDACYETVEVEAGVEPMCGKEAHEHTDACYTEVETIICGMEECAPHHHDASCYNKLVCMEQHEHTDTCYDAPADAENPYTCGHVAHKHTEECYFDDGNLRCTLEEHEHDLLCRQNFQADLEGESAWTGSFGSVRLTGNWSEDVLAIATSQIGYAESGRNFILTGDNSVSGYTRYGAWYKSFIGAPDCEKLEYADWSAMFCAFCVNYARVEGFPCDAAGQSWIAKLSDAGLYRAAGSYEPKPGDLVFFDNSRVGVVSAVADGLLTTVEGDVDNAVAPSAHALNSGAILGYAEIPVNPAYDPEVTAIVSEPAEDGTVAEITGKLPKDAKAVISVVEYTKREFRNVLENLDEEKEEVELVASYDIKIVLADGTEWQPDESVQISLKPSADIPAGDGKVLGVIHVSDAGEANKISASVGEEGEVIFPTDGFSVFTLVRFTIDFHYDGKFFSLQGMESALLSEIIEALEIKNCDINDIKSVAFSNEDLTMLLCSRCSTWRAVQGMRFRACGEQLQVPDRRQRVL